jgi:hypothetical protein
MEKLIKLKKNDIISFQYGTRRITAKVISNDGTHITWQALDWRKECTKTFGYYQLISRQMLYIGKYRPLLKRLISLNFSEIDPL